jgi:hypothetical protein
VLTPLDVPRQTRAAICFMVKVVSLRILNASNGEASPKDTRPAGLLAIKNEVFYWLPPKAWLDGDITVGVRYCGSDKYMILIYALSLSLLGNMLTIADRESVFQYPPSVETEKKLLSFVFGPENTVFDRALCASLSLALNDEINIKILHASFLFYYPQKDILPSQSEMVLPMTIRYSKGKTSRTESNTEIPADYIRVFDSTRKALSAEIEVLFSITNEGRVSAPRFGRRIFTFQFISEWREIGPPVKIPMNETR